MNFSLLIHEWSVICLGLILLMADLWLPPASKRKLGYAAAAGLGVILLYSILFVRAPDHAADYAFGGMYAFDGLALFFKRFFLLAAILVLLMSVEFADRIEAGISEYYALILFALSGMLFASSANDFSLLFVSLELITVTFYVLTSFQRARLSSLEAGVKYLIIGALSTGFTVFGIALVYGLGKTLNFGLLASVAGQFKSNPVFLFGLLLILTGLGFKIAAFPFQIWAPDVYQGAPSPTTAFLAVGSKAAGFVLLLRVLFTAVPQITQEWSRLLIVISAITILYGNLCAIPQRNIKRLLGYSSIAHAGYMLLGISALSAAGQSAVLYYLSGYLFTVLGAFTVICVALRQIPTEPRPSGSELLRELPTEPRPLAAPKPGEGGLGSEFLAVEDISALAGLNQRSPLLAATMTLALVSLAGIPPLAGFFGKFLLFKAVLAQAPAQHAYYWLVAIAIAGVVISIYYYFGLIRAIYWSRDPADLSPIRIPWPTWFSLVACIAGMFYLGLLPNRALKSATTATGSISDLAGQKALTVTLSRE